MSERLVAELSPKVKSAMSDVELLAGETIDRVFQADGFFLGTNPIAKLFAAIQSFLVTITGGHIRVFLIFTNRRVLLVQSRQVWCGCQRVRGANAIAVDAIKEAGCARETQLCCFHSRVIHLQSLTQRHSMIVKHFSDEDLKTFLAYVSEHILQNITHV